PQTLLVVDFGAASLGVAVLRTFPGALTVLAQAGETWLGGEDLTQSIVARLVQGLQRRRGVLIDESQAARQALRWHLRQAAEQAKVALTIVEEAGLVLAPEQLGVPAAIDVALTRAQFEALVRPRLEEALTVVEQALAAARLAGSEVDAVLLAGGSSQVPLWQALLLARLRRARLLRDFNPLTGVALGAALWAGMLGEVHCPACGLAQPFEAAACPRCGRPLSGEPRLACPRCFVPNDARRSGCVKCGTSLRAARQAGNLARVRNPRTTRGPSGLRCSRCGLVAPIGATVCAACGEAIAPFVGALSRSSLGIEGEGGRIDAILPRGRPLPTPEPAHRTLVAAGPLLELAIYEGDKPFACQNERCAVLHVALPEGVPLAGRVDVALGLDRDGLLSAQARLAGDRGHELDAWLEWE
ncbi:MAG TPA: Hsp70 family protein, partial [Anaerolineae bacterium]|nr:Hsp70 family protein [Anaerolineae bacterium]